MSRPRVTLLCVVTAGLLLAWPAGAASQLAALDLGFTAFSPSTARDVNAAGQVYVEGVAVAFGQVRNAAIFLPPHPGGSVLQFACYTGCPACYPSCPGPILPWVDRPRGLNAAGRIIGTRYHLQPFGYWVPFPSAWEPPAFVHEAYSPVPPETAAGGFVNHLNASGASVGSVITAPYGPTVTIPYTWSTPAAAPVALASLLSSAGPIALRISDPGVIVGDRLGATPRAVVWTSPSAPAFAFLGELPGGATSHALDLDAGGRVVGSSDDGSGSQVAVLWRPSGAAHTVVALPVPFAGGSCQEATAISEGGGLIAGNCTTAAGDRRGVVWRDDGASIAYVLELLPLAGAEDSAVYGLGGSRLAAGSSGDPPRAVLWNLPIVPAVPALSRPGLALLSLALAASLGLAVRRRARRPEATPSAPRAGLR